MRICVKFCCFQRTNKCLPRVRVQFGMATRWSHRTHSVPTYHPFCSFWFRNDWFIKTPCQLLCTEQVDSSYCFVICFPQVFWSCLDRTPTFWLRFYVNFPRSSHALASVAHWIPPWPCLHIPDTTFLQNHLWLHSSEPVEASLIQKTSASYCLCYAQRC